MYRYNFFKEELNIVMNDENMQISLIVLWSNTLAS